MAVNSPLPIEVNDFKFVQLRKLKVIQNNESIPSNVINLVATSSRHGLIFVGLQDGFKVLKVENILDLDEDKQQFRIPAENFAYQKVLSPPPLLMSLSADDMTLAVCVIRNSRLVADMYDIRAFADPVSARLREDEVPLPFINVQLSSQCTELKDFMWNPVVSEMYAFCLGNGEVHVHELAEMTLKIIADLPSTTGATAVCWSPKGKQLVLGRGDGYLSQHKPTLQEVKKIPPPVLNGNKLTVLNVCWLSTTLFAVVFIPATNDPNKIPSLVFVSSQKGVPVSYTNCSDVCLGGIATHTLRYTMYHQAEWGMLICTSSSSMETAIVGSEGDNKSVWLQWNLEDSSRADLPLDGNRESYPLGMGIIYCPQRRIIISDVEAYPPMPLFFLLSSSGLLCPFHMLNRRPGAANLVFPSEPICRDGERRRQGLPPIGSPTNYELQNQVNSAAASTPPSFGINRMDNSSLNAFGTGSPNMNSIQIGGQLGAPPILSPQVFQNVEPPPTMPTLVAGPQAVPDLVPQFQSFSNTPKQTMHQNEPATFGAGSFATPPTSGPSLVSSFISPPTEVSYLPPAPAFASPHDVSRPLETTTVIPKPTTVAIEQSVAEDTKEPEISSLDAETYTAAIIDEIVQFEAELQDLKSRVPNLDIGSKEEMTYFKKNLLLLAEFDKELNDRMQQLNIDIHDLKTASLENFSMIGDANSREQRRNDANYNLMLQDRALDPINAKRMQTIQKYYQYLTCQLQEADERLDQDLAEFCQKRKAYEKTIKDIPSSEAIYQSVINNQNIIHVLMMNFQTVTDLFHKQAKKKSPRLNYSLNGSSEIDLSQLAESLLQDKPEFDVNPQIEGIPRPLRKKLSVNIQSTLRDALAHRKITCVKPTLIAHPAQSRLLSSTMIQMDCRKFNVDAPTKTKTAREAKINLSPIQRAPSKDAAATIPKVPLDVKPLSAFTATNANPRFIGGITQGIPVASGFARSMPNITSQAAAEGQHIQSENVAASHLANQNAASNIYEDITPPSSPEKSFQATNEGSGVTPAMNAYSFTPVLNSNARTDGAVDQRNFINIGKPAMQPIPASDQTVIHIKIIDETKAPNVAVQMPLSVPFTTISKDNSNNSNKNIIIPISVATDSTGSLSFGRPALFNVTPVVSQPLQTCNTQILKGTAPNNDAANTENEIPVFQNVSNNLTAPIPRTAPVFGQQPENSQSFLSQATSSSIFGNTFEHPKSSTPITTATTKQSIPATSSKFKFSLSPATSLFGLPNASASSSVQVPPDVQKTEPPTSVVHPQISTPSSVSQAVVAPTFSFNQTKTDNTVSKPSFTFSFGQPPLSSSSFSQALTNTATAKDPVTSTSEPACGPSTSLVQATVAGTMIKSLPSFGQIAVTSSDSRFGLMTNAFTTSKSIPFGQTAVTSTPLGSTFSLAVANTTTPNSIPLSQTVTTTTSTISQVDITATTLTSVPFRQTVITSSVPGSFAETVATSASVIIPFAQPEATAVSSSLGQPATTAISSSLGQSATTAVNSTFSQPAATTVSSSFGQPAATTVSFGQPAATTVSFGQSATTTVNPSFSQPPATTVSPSFSQTTPSTVSPFGQVTETTTAVASPPSFSQPVTTSTPSSLFGQTPATNASSSPFKAPTTSTPSIFGQIPSGGSFNQNTASSFGQAAVSPNAAPFSQTGFLGAATPGNLFGQRDQTNSSSIFGGQSAASGFSFGKPSNFGQSPSGSFGLTKAVFGQTPTSPSATFGQSGDSSMFGQSGFLGGLGGKANGQNASKNFFGSVNASTGGENTSLFGNQGASTFGSKPGGSFSGGSFSSSGGGSVAQSGFGAFQQPQQKSAGFGAPPSFGGSPGFGGSSPPAFGAAPSFGSSQPTSPFGTAQSSFSSFASADAPTFGSLASQTGSSSFTNLSPQSSPIQGSLFGSSSLFGGGAANAPSFGSPTQQSGFGSPSSSGGSSAFSQWRS